VESDVATIADVAQHAGVGLGTVSRVLNGSPKVRPATRERVLAAIEELGYRPNPLARGLSLGRTQTIGVVVPFFTHPSAVERLRGVAAALDGSVYDLVVFNVASPGHPEEPFAAMARRGRADGLLVMSLPVPAADLERLTTARVPVVLVDTTGPGVPAVVTDDVEGGRMATEHLVRLGHRAIAFIGDDPANAFGFTSSTRREEGYREVLAAHDLPCHAALVRHGPHDQHVAARLTSELLAEPDPPTAVFAASDVQALGVLTAVAAAGSEVPHDVSVIGFDDIEVAAYAGLTTIRQPLFDSGYLGARLLLDALEGVEPPAAEVHELPLELVERTTTCRVTEPAA
jgi:DNA-binding LacI/PurR family transcriptional regulator